MFLSKKNIKVAKREHAFKGQASTYNVETLNSLNAEHQLKDTESTFKSKLIELLTQLRGFKFVIYQFWHSKRQKVKIKQSFIQFLFKLKNRNNYQ